ncbi:MAG: N-6 DNA methylase [Anaerolineae bacterium]|nr:N-6 DNA methylase [Anaerolineae bacterium]
MDTKEAAREKIGDLVNRFRNTPAKQRDHYNEQQTREYFILPLFRALGWDTENPAEMSAEEQISRGFVDFGFYLNGVVKFYLETKKVSSDLNRPENVKQAINYAWIKGVTWAVLTDFEGLKVLNAEWQDNPERAVVLDLHYADFAEKGFDDLWLLSKESMLAGELDRVAEKFHLKIKKLPVNQYLLSNLTNWRKELFAEIRGWDKSLWATDARAVDNAIQRLLDRLIFIRTVEDRGIENRLLQPLLRDTRKGKNLFKEIQSLFRQLDDMYNATLFAEDKIDYLEVHNPGLITKIVNGLYDVGGGTFAFYDFNAIDADVLGAIYEQYLGYKAIDPDAKQAIDFEQEKRRKRKSQGIYYTPQFVVRYIVQNTLGKLLETGVDPYSLRIVDPACGSGSFLIEAFDVLDKWIRTHGSEVDRINHRVRRLRILRECIYGVDLDEQAVEVARLNLLLRATGERGKLPLLTNIRRGNSLIHDPAIAGDAAFDWQTAFPEVFAERSRSLYFVTFVTHNSRVSERMVTYGSQAGEPFILNAQDRLLMAQKIAETCQRHHIAVVAWNVLPDHVHMVIAAENEEALDEQVRKIKGASSFAFARERGMEKGQHIWAQKFNHRLITDENMLREVVEYVMSNHRKHAEHWGEELITAWGEDTDTTNTPNDAVSAPSDATDNPNNGLKPIVPAEGQYRAAGQFLSTAIRAICQPFEEAIRIRGGFDVVIGNPPYVWQTVDDTTKAYYQKQFESAKMTSDLYVYFVEKGHQLLNPNGRFGMIVSNKWMKAAYGKALRQFLKEKASVDEIIDFAGLPVFEDATVRTVIVLSRPIPGQSTTIRYTPPPAEERFRQLWENRGGDLPAIVNETSVQYPISQLSADTWSLGRPDAGELIARLTGTIATVSRTNKGLKPLVANTGDDIGRGTGRSTDHHDLSEQPTVSRKGNIVDPNKGLKPLVMSSGEAESGEGASGMGKIVSLTDYVGRVYRGLVTGLNEAYVIDNATRAKLIRSDPGSAEIIKPVLAGRDVRRYGLEESGKFLLWVYRGISIENYPAVLDYLRPFKSKLEKRWDKGDEWWELRSCDYYDLFEQPKIIYPDIAPTTRFVLDKSGYFGLNTTYFIPGEDLYLLGILNSKLGQFCFVEICAALEGSGDNYLRFFGQYLKSFPVYRPDLDDPTDKKRHDDMAQMVEKMLALKPQYTAAEANFDDQRHWFKEQIEQLDAAIDRLVYELYGLTEAEIALVEGR